MSQREFDIKFGNEYGQVEFSLGNTKFFTKVIYELTEPKIDRP
jgi:exosome complex RNA-binding protein Rrp42 (RNase PH superfamily)